MKHIAVLLGLLASLATTAFGATFTVSNLNNAGAGSLRQAILDANAAGPGPHDIDFTTTGTITLLSNLPIIGVSDLTIDGGSTITVSANGADISRRIFRANGNADGLTVRNIDIKNTGLEAFRFDGSPTDITIENVYWYNESGNFYNYGINYRGNVNGMTIRNVVAENQQNYGAVIEVSGSATDLTIDGLTFDNTKSNHYNQEVVRINGAATNVLVENCQWNLDRATSGNDGDVGMRFNNTVNGLEVRDVECLNCEVYPIYVRRNSSDVHIRRFTATNGDGYGGAFGMRFQGDVTDLELDTVSLDLDHTGSGNDGDYGIYFGGTVTNADIDSLVIHDAERYAIFVNRAATNVSIRRSRFDNFDSWGNNQTIRFNRAANDILVERTVIDGDRTGTGNDGNIGILFNNDNTSNITLRRVSFNEYDEDGVWFYDVDDLIIDSCTFTANRDGVEFYNNDARTNNVITSSTFANNTRGGIVINVRNGTTEFRIDSNTISDNGSHGIWLYNSGGVKDIGIAHNTIFDNGGAGIYNERADGVDYFANSIFGHGQGINNALNDGNNDLENADGDVPFLTASTNVGGGNYDVTFDLPGFCGTGDCDVQFFTNDDGDPFLNGRDYITEVSGLGSGTHTVTLNSNGNTLGYWTATLRANSLNGSVSEFSDPLVIQPEFPAGVGTGIALWMSADVDVTEVGGNDITLWEDRAGLNTPAYYNSNPDLLDSAPDLVNFNPVVDFDGNDYIRWDGNDFTDAFTEGEMFLTVRETVGINAVNGYPASFGGGGGPHYTWSNQLIYDDFGSADRKRWNPNDHTVAPGEGASGATTFAPDHSTLDYQVYNVLSETNNWQASFNGFVSLVDNTNTATFASGIPHLGAAESRVFTGRIPEVVLYNRVLNADEREKVNTYMAIRYGLTLGHDYVASDWNGTTGTVFYALDGTYDHDIAGIARDDNGTLLQKQSRSMNDDAIVTMYTGDQIAALPASNEANTILPADMNALVWGTNDAAADFTVPYTPTTFTPPPTTPFFHMGRIWRVEETGSVGTVTVTIPTTTRAQYMLVHTGDDFSVGTPQEIQLQDDGNGHLYAVLDLDDGEYFTFGAMRKAPGCVAGALRLWLDADFPLVPISGGIRWQDETVNGLDVEQTANSREALPQAPDEGHNFHPSIAFDGNDVFETDAQVLTSSTADGSVFFVAQYDNFGGWDSPVDFQADDPHLGRYSGSNDPAVWNNGSSPNPIRATSLDIIQSQNQISGYLWGGGTNGGLEMTLDGSTFSEPNFDGVSIGYTSDFGVGAYRSGAEGINGTMNEVLVYERTLTPAEKEQVQSYLAIKYGATLPHDYVAGDGTVLWDVTANAAYSNDIAGLMRNDCDGLDQRQSRSVNGDAIVAVGHGTLTTSNLTNPNKLDNDYDALLWGNDGGALSAQQTGIPTAFTGCPFRMGREWLVQERGSVSNLTLRIGGTNFEFIDGYENVSLFVDTDGDGDFTTGSPAIIAADSIAAQGMAWFSGVDLNDGDIFTVGWNQPTPGGVFVTGSSNGIRFNFYAGTDNNVGDGIQADLTSTGYVGNFVNPDDVFTNEDPDFSLELFTRLQIDAPGNYTFRFVSLDDYGAIWVNGNLELNHTGACCPTVTTSPIALGAGLNDLQVNWSDIGGANTLRLQYNGPDTGGGWADIPEDKLFTDATLSQWYRADVGVDASGDATTASGWNDQSGQGNNTVTTEGTPTFYSTTAANLINFNPAIDFQDDAMDGPDNPTGMAYDYKDRTVFAVGNPSAYGGSNYLWSTGRDGSNSSFFALWASNGQGRIVGWSNDLAANNFWSIDQPRLATGRYENTGVVPTDNAELFGDGGLAAQGTHNWRTRLNDNEDIAIGDAIDRNSRWNGEIGEIIYYPWSLSEDERHRVGTYLGVKYGLTLGYDYLSNNSTVVWDTLTGRFHHNVAGIGYEECGALDQRQSRSENAGSAVTIYNGTHLPGSLPTTNAANGSGFSTTGSYMIWGATDSATTYTRDYPSSEYIDIMERTWLVQETGTVGTVTVQPADPNADILIVDPDGDFTDGNSQEFQLDSISVPYDFTDGQYFTFGRVICVEVNTVACATTTALDLTSFVEAYDSSGTWTETTASGADISDPTAVDFSAVALGTYEFEYRTDNLQCTRVIVERLTSIPAPVVDDITVCEGTSTELSITPPSDRVEVLLDEPFNGSNGRFILRSRCTGVPSSSCYVDDSPDLANRSLNLDLANDFTAWTRWWHTWVYDVRNLRFGRLRNEEISITTDAYTILPGETVQFSADSRRYWGRMEADDYVRFYYDVDGSETLFADRSGHISRSWATSSGTYTNTGTTPVTFQLRMKVKNSWGEGHIVDNLFIQKVLAPPTYTWYSDVALTTVEGTGLVFDPNTPAGSSETYYVTRSENGCESPGDPVTVTVVEDSAEPMNGESVFYCAGSPVDLTGHIFNYQSGGTWSDDDTSGVDLSDPTAVDLSALANGSYNFTYTLPGTPPCAGEEALVTVNVGLDPERPLVDDIDVCDGGSTEIIIPADPLVEEVVYDQTFQGSNGGYIFLGRCSGSASNTCRVDDFDDLGNRGLRLEPGNDFSAFTRWASFVYDVGNLRFGRLMDQELVISTDSFTLLPGEIATFSGRSRRHFGSMEAADHVQFYYVVNGVETLFDDRSGPIPTSYQLSQGIYENTSGSPQEVQLRVKVRNSFDEGHIIDDLRISKALNKPTYSFYDDAGLTSLVATGNSYDPGTAVSTTETYYITSTLNGCESVADTVTVRVNPNNLSAMDGGEVFFCAGSGAVDLTASITNYVPGGSWTDVDASGVTLGTGTAVDVSALADGSYRYLYTVSGSCGEESAEVVVHIGLIGDLPYIVPDGTTETALTECLDGDWIYFLDPTDDSQRILAINRNGNTVSPADFSVLVDVDAPAVDLERAAGTGATGQATRLMRRMVQVNCDGCDTMDVNGGLEVRIYWNSTEQATAGTAMDALMLANSITGTKVWEWFKVPHDVSGIPANLAPDGIQNAQGGMTWTVPDVTGTEVNGVEYVQFNNIQTFSTFGGGWHVNDPNGSILPVELISFTARALDETTARLDWVTASEIDNAGFEVLHSRDGLDFESVGWVDGRGTTTDETTYRFDHRDLDAGIHYYRLRQMDVDGTPSETQVRVVTLDGDALFDLAVRPNPSKGRGTVHLTTDRSERVRLTVYDASGRRVIERDMELEPGLHTVAIDDDLAAGLYTVAVQRMNGAPVTVPWVIMK